RSPPAPGTHIKKTAAQARMGAGRSDARTRVDPPFARTRARSQPLARVRTRRRDFPVVVAPADLLLEKAAFGICGEKCIENGGRHVRVTVSVTRVKLDLHGFGFVMIANRSDRLRLHTNAPQPVNRRPFGIARWRKRQQ